MSFEAIETWAHDIRNFELLQMACYAFSPKLLTFFVKATGLRELQSENSSVQLKIVKKINNNIYRYRFFSTFVIKTSISFALVSVK